MSQKKHVHTKKRQKKCNKIKQKQKTTITIKNKHTQKNIKKKPPHNFK
jgi:hypothetical protein